MTFQILGTEIDKKNNNLILKHSDHVSFTPAYTFFIREVASLIDNGNGLPYTYWNDKNCSIIWAEQENKVVGILCYDNSFSKKLMPFLAITLTAVDENFRQRGIHQIMNKHFEQQAKLKNCIAIRATVNLNNHVRFKTAEKDNLLPLMYVMSKKIK
jgi:hypothetical protein